MFNINRLWMSLALALICVALMLLSADTQSWLYFDRNLITQGQIWRLISGHISHTDLEHLFWNVSALVVLSSIIEKSSRWLLLLSLLLGIVTVDVLLLSPWAGINYYCGLSGALNSLLVVALWLIWKQCRSRWVIVTAALCLGKIALEIGLNDTVISHISWPPYPLAHLAGAIGGVLTLVLTNYSRLVVLQCDNNGFSVSIRTVL